MPFKNRIRLPFYLSKAQFPTERSVFRKADGTTKVLSVVVRNTYEGVTDYLPEAWHRRLIIALSHDEVTIEGDNYLGDVVLDGDYSIEWQDFLDYPVAQATFSIQVTPFNATNSNCVSCAQATQLALVDDTIPGEFADGDEGAYNVAENDSICCYPATFELVSTNSSFIEDAAIDQSGNLTFTALNPVPGQNGVNIATYRVTCEDGSYDEADVYANFNGSAGPTCCQPFNVSVDEAVTEITFEAGCNPDDGFVYDFRTADNPGVPIFTGSVDPGDRSLPIPLVVYSTSGDYIFTIYSNCGITQSPTTTFPFTVPPSVGDCYAFDANYSAVDGPGSATFSYMNCAGTIVNQIVFRFSPVRVCAAVGEGNVPVYWASDRPFSTFTPMAECGAPVCEIWQNTTLENAENLSYISCSGEVFEGVTFTPGSNDCMQAGTLTGEGVGNMSNLGPC